MAESASSLPSIVLAGGCFWCTEAVFQRVRGVQAVESGYANGAVAKPTYEQVCQGDTGCAEVVRVQFDPQQVSLETLLQVFFATHDPTTLNRQGNDVGTQYRSGIYYQDDAQRAQAERVKATVQSHSKDKIVTEIAPLRHYHPAEAYHQNYYAQHPGQGYCAFVITPKLHRFETQYREWLHDA